MARKGGGKGCVASSSSSVSLATAHLCWGPGGPGPVLGAGAPGTLGGRQGGPGPSVWNRVPGALGGGSVSAGRAWVGCAQEGRSRRNRRVEFLEGSGGNGRLRPGRLRAGGAQPQRCRLRALGVTQSWVTLVSRDCAENLVAVLTVVWCETPTKPNLANAPERSPCWGRGGAPVPGPGQRAWQLWSELAGGTGGRRRERVRPAAATARPPLLCAGRGERREQAGGRVDHPVRQAVLRHRVRGECVSPRPLPPTPACGPPASAPSCPNRGPRRKLHARAKLTTKFLFL